jgi:transposase-like protein
VRGDPIFLFCDLKTRPMARQALNRLNNRAEVSHQPTRQRERQMRGFKPAVQSQRFASTPCCERGRSSNGML